MEHTGKTRGLRHLALRVRDVKVSQAFYERLFDMKVVWHPDPDNVYLSTGVDNLALHQVPAEEFEKFAPSPPSSLGSFGVFDGFAGKRHCLVSGSLGGRGDDCSHAKAASGRQLFVLLGRSRFQYYSSAF